MNFIKTEIDGVYIIEPKIFEDARAKVLDTWQEGGFFRPAEPDRKEGDCGYSQNSGPDADGEVYF